MTFQLAMFPAFPHSTGLKREIYVSSGFEMKNSWSERQKIGQKDNWEGREA